MGVLGHRFSAGQGFICCNPTSLQVVALVGTLQIADQWVHLAHLDFAIEHLVYFTVHPLLVLFEVFWDLPDGGLLGGFHEVVTLDIFVVKHREH